MVVLFILELKRDLRKSKLPFKNRSFIYDMPYNGYQDLIDIN